MKRIVSDQTATLELAASLLALAMHESHAPMDVLGGALERMRRALRPGNGGHAAVAAGIDECRATLEREIALCIEGLQFHDRLMQQLAHVRNCLAGLSGGQAQAEACCREEAWLQLRANLWSRLSSDSQRALLDLLVPTAPAHAGAEARKLNASEGSIELF